jgi:hypothetical protein
VSAAILLRKQEDIDTLNSKIKDLPVLQRVEFHFMFDTTGGPYPINVLRNVATKYVQTGAFVVSTSLMGTAEYIVTLDVDFVPNEDMYAHMRWAVILFFLTIRIREFVKTHKKELNSKYVYAIAPFELDDGAQIPSTKMRQRR